MSLTDHIVDTQLYKLRNMSRLYIYNIPISLDFQIFMIISRSRVLYNNIVYFFVIGYRPATPLDAARVKRTIYMLILRMVFITIQPR